MKNWEQLPREMRHEVVRPYYEQLKKRGVSLFFKRLFDIVVSFVLLVVLFPVLLVLAVAIKLDSPGPVFYRQVRITRYGKEFRIFKFRSMVTDADKKGSLVTVSGDSRITRVGRFIRKCRLDELPQLLNVLTGDMTFVGTRPEVAKYVDGYTPEMLATLLLPAGITSEASIRYKDEDKLLSAADDVDRVYMEQVLPEKMKWNLGEIRDFRLLRELLTMFRTIGAVVGKDEDS